MDKDRLWFWGPVAVAVVLSVLWVRPCGRLAPEDEEKARSGVVPLNARDPSSLVMAPMAEKFR